MYQLAIQRDFIARHRLVGGDWGAENETHSHHYRAEILVDANELDEHGFLVDLVDLRRAVDEVLGGVRDRCLNELPEFAGRNPSLENFCRILHECLSAQVERPGIALTVRLWENERDWAAYRRTSPARAAQR